MECYNIIECYYNINITLDEKRDAKFLSFFAELVTKVTFLKEGDKETILFVKYKYENFNNRLKVRLQK